MEHEFIQYQLGDIPFSDFRRSLKRIEQEYGVQISIVGQAVKYLRKDLLEVGVRPDVRDWINSVSEGDRIERIKKFHQQDNEKMLIVGFPLKSEGEVVAAAFVYTPMTNIDQLAKPVLKSIWLVALISAGPFILLLWFATGRFVRPIKEMSQAAGLVADGNFSSRVKVSGKDEIANLGSSFNRMAERIQRVEVQRRQLITELSHELRTPLTSIRATLQALSDGIISQEEQKEYADLSLVEAIRLGKLIDNLQELSAFEEHQIEYHFKPLDLIELVESTIAQYQLHAEQLGMHLLMHKTRDRQPVWVNGDPEKLKQVLINVIGNALHHNDKDTRVVIRLSREKDKVIIMVKDDGKGVSQDHLPHLFERFYKAETSRSTKDQVLGLPSPD
nr:HAMP domain-containing protein [Cohnella kolymensis]